MDILTVKQLEIDLEISFFTNNIQLIEKKHEMGLFFGQQLLC
jgi:hypothetical protein